MKRHQAGKVLETNLLLDYLNHLLSWQGLTLRPFAKPKGLSASGTSSTTRFLSSETNELRDRLNLLLKEKQAGSSSNIIIEIIALLDKLLEKNAYLRNNNQPWLNCFFETTNAKFEIAFSS